MDIHEGLKKLRKALEINQAAYQVLLTAQDRHLVSILLTIAHCYNRNNSEMGCSCCRNAIRDALDELIANLLPVVEDCYKEIDNLSKGVGYGKK